MSVCLSVCLSVTEKSTISFVSDQGGLIATAEDERPKVILKRALVLHGKYKHSCSHFKGAQWNQIYWLILSCFFLSHPLLCLIRHIEAVRIINISDTHARTHARTHKPLTLLHTRTDLLSPTLCMHGNSFDITLILMAIKNYTFNTYKWLSTVRLNRSIVCLF